MIERIITGGQQGSDLAAWRAAKAVQIPTGGYMPPGFLTEQGPRPEFEPLFGARALDYGGYRERTWANIRAADAVLVFCAGTSGYRSPGTQLALRLCIELERPCRFVDLDRQPSMPEATADWLRADPAIRILCCGGNRESRAPGIGARVEDYLGEVFRLLREGQGS